MMENGTSDGCQVTREEARLDYQPAALVDKLAQLPKLDLPPVHRFTPGLYIRELFMPKGTLVVSKIHKTEHPYVVSQGHAAVFIPGVGVQQIKAPFCGITKPGTQRILFIHEDCIWTTFHPTNETDLEKIEASIIEPMTAPIEVSAEVRQQLEETV